MAAKGMTGAVLNSPTEGTLNHQHWIDIFRGIAIILVVLGHATPIFNSYIYQFHVAAFFFISGWNAKPEKYRITEIIIKRTYSLILPLISLLILYGVGIKIIQITGKISLFYEAGYQTSIINLLTGFFANGTLPDVLGAGWFLLVLFGVSITARILFLCSGKNWYLYLLITAVLFYLGYRFILGTGLPFGMHIIPTAHGYYGAGVFAGKLFRDRSQQKTEKRSYIIMYLLITVVTTGNMFAIDKLLHGQGLMDLAGGTIVHPGWSTLAVANGILWLYAISKIISLIPIRLVTRMFSYIGKSSMGIMLLHFILFRVTSCFLYLFHLVPREACLHLVPTGAEAVYWPVYAIIGICGSLVLWAGISLVPVLSDCMGMNRAIPQRLINTRGYERLQETVTLIAGVVVSGTEIYATKNIKNNKNRFFLHFFLFLTVLILIAAGSSYSLQIYNRQRSEALQPVLSAIEVSFPYHGTDIDFQDGWLEQTKDEQYRWVQKQSVFCVNLGTQSTITIKGYVPPEVQNLSEVRMYCNDTLIAEKEIHQEQELILSGTLSTALTEKTDQFRIEFNGERIPTQKDADKRIFSALITSITIE